jgi:hypothetical protein
VKLLSTRTRAQLWKLQDAVRQAAQEREKVLRVLMNARGALAPEARHELWLEFSCVDQEYQFQVRQLTEFCERHGSATGSNSRPLSDNGVTES